MILGGKQLKANIQRQKRKPLAENSKVKNGKPINFLTLAQDLVICFTWFSPVKAENPLDN
ncbi:MAG: hypothetical protein C4567_09995 [Deltaproteobacteria bacterium]|nr:MAG: hypothetical protein C4567_09995 [Deltaproteobacteria bacterium]